MVISQQKQNKVIDWQANKVMLNDFPGSGSRDLRIPGRIVPRRRQGRRRKALRRMAPRKVARRSHAGSSRGSAGTLGHRLLAGTSACQASARFWRRLAKGTVCLWELGMQPSSQCLKQFRTRAKNLCRLRPVLVASHGASVDRSALDDVLRRHSWLVLRSAVTCWAGSIGHGPTFAAAHVGGAPQGWEFRTSRHRVLKLRGPKRLALSGSLRGLNYQTWSKSSPAGPNRGP